MSYNVYLPFVSNSKNVPVIGVHSDRYPMDGDLSYQTENILGGWAAINVWWMQQERQKGYIEFTPTLDDWLRSLKSDVNVLAIVKAAPAWARHNQHCECAAPFDYDAYGSFIEQLVKCYSNIKAIEVWNEPAVRELDAPYGGQLGCLVQDDFYSAGRDVYSRLIDSVITSVGDKVSVWAGSLISNNSNDLAFLRGWIDAGIKPDVLTLHAYPKYPSTPEQWKQLFQSYINNVQEIVPDLPIVFSETNYLGDGSTEHRQIQAEYMQWFYDDACYDYELVGGLFYVVQDNTWGNCALIENGVKYPAYNVYQKLLEEKISCH